MWYFLAPYGICHNRYLKLNAENSKSILCLILRRKQTLRKARLTESLGKNVQSSKNTITLLEEEHVFFVFVMWEEFVLGCFYWANLKVFAGCVC